MSVENINEEATIALSSATTHHVAKEQTTKETVVTTVEKAFETNFQNCSKELHFQRSKREHIEDESHHLGKSLKSNNPDDGAKQKLNLKLYKLKVRPFIKFEFKWLYGSIATLLPEFKIIPVYFYIFSFMLFQKSRKKDIQVLRKKDIQYSIPNTNEGEAIDACSLEQTAKETTAIAAKKAFVVNFQNCSESQEITDMIKDFDGSGAAIRGKKGSGGHKHMSGV